jgi:PHD/YefM family antitoxin component YafN of YafNO toxin-antitoxin module
MPKIMPITDLRNTTEVSNLCHAVGEPVFITKNGYGDMVIMSMETYDDLVNTAAVDAAIAAAEADIQQGGQLHPVEDVLAALRRKHLKSDD